MGVLGEFVELSSRVRDVWNQKYSLNAPNIRGPLFFLAIAPSPQQRYGRVNFGGGNTAMLSSEFS
jgi:hypothetical protein